ncbi:MAG: DUF4143 domain-containing protein [Lachnospiraceae bacterium]|nr:DUF4143 domain-containing protein [Lachnospiraceae bacterium]
MICYLTKYQTAETAMNGAMAGELFETYVVSEILKSYVNACKAQPAGAPLMASLHRFSI